MTNRNAMPYLFIIFGFLLLIIIGGVLLRFPFASKTSISFVDSFFTSTSAVCVTGLLTVSDLINHFSLWGIIIILLLVEIGGLGFITIVMYILHLFGAKLGVQEQFLIKEAMNQSRLKGMVRLVRFVISRTIRIQAIGAFCYFLVFIKKFSFLKAVGVSIFFSVSAFNNAGFNPLRPSETSLVQNNPWFNIITIFLVIIGGIGFFVLFELSSYRKAKHLSIHTKIVLKQSLILLILGTILFKLTEGIKLSWFEAFFHSVNARSSGFNFYSYNYFSLTGSLVLILLMFIGTSPTGTGGGIKTSTFYVVIAYLFAFAKGKTPQAFKRKLANDSIAKAFVLITFSLGFIFTMIILLSFLEQPQNESQLYKIIFEVFASFTTSGISFGITRSLQSISKGLLMLTMLLGRIGPITVISIWNQRWNLEKLQKIQYLEEKIIIG